MLEPTVPSLDKQESTVMPQVMPSFAPVPTQMESMDISADKPEAFSKALLKIEDIDVNDGDNPQLVSEYVNDIYEYMRILEVRVLGRKLKFQPALITDSYDCPI